MALPALGWKKLLRGSVACTTNPVQEVLFAIHATITAATYYNSDARNVATDPNSIRGPAKDEPALTDAVYWGYVAGGAKTVIGGTSAGPAPSVAAPDATIPANVMGINTVADAGTYVDWEAANPFNAGRPFGNWRVTTFGVATYQWDFYECQEASMLVIAEVSSVPQGFLSGCYIDPLSTLPPDAETNGRVVGQANCVATTRAPDGRMFSYGEYETNNAGAFLDHHTSANENHHGILTPRQGGAFRYINLALMNSYIVQPPPAEMGKTPSAQSIGQFGLPFTLEGEYRMAGVSREWGWGPAVPPGSVFQSSGVDKGYATMGWSWAIGYDTMVVKAA